MKPIPGKTDPHLWAFKSSRLNYSNIFHFVAHCGWQIFIKIWTLELERWGHRFLLYHIKVMHPGDLPKCELPFPLWKWGCSDLTVRAVVGMGGSGSWSAGASFWLLRLSAQSSRLRMAPHLISHSSILPSSLSFGLRLSNFKFQLYYFWVWVTNLILFSHFPHM